MVGELKPGQRVGNYAIVRLLGAGGMGAVYEAEHPEIGRQVAIKVLSSQLGQSEELSARFVAEARTVNRIAHPHIIDIYDFGRTEDGQLYYTMELLSGHELMAEMERQGAMPPATVAPFFEQICAALSAAHSHGVVHRDLKPENIFIVRRHPLTVKLLDFGIAKLLEPEAGKGHLTSTGMVMGSPLTMAPEQAAGQPELIGPHTDIYSLGVILFWMLAGRPPFEANAPGILLAKHITQQAPTLDRFVASSPPALVQLVDQCLAKEPRERPANAQLLFMALTDVVRSAGPAATAIPQTLHRGPSAPPEPQASSAAALSAAEARTQQPKTGQGTTTLGGAAGESVQPPPGRGSIATTLAVLFGVLALAGGGTALYFGLQRQRPDQPTARVTEGTGEQAAAKGDSAMPAAAQGRGARASAFETPPRKKPKATPSTLGLPTADAGNPRIPALPPKRAEPASPGATGGTRQATVDGTLSFTYRARIGQRDHYNSRGRRLTSARRILRQERANYHRYHIRDPDDGDDTVFHKKQRRNWLLRVLKGGIPRHVARAIVNGTPLVQVRIVGQRGYVTVIRN